MTTENGRTGRPGTLSALPAGAPSGPRLADGGRVLRVLGPAECFELLEFGGVGRVGFVSASGIAMLPVNFAVSGKVIIFRTAPDTLLALNANAPVSFEADRFDQELREGWSVLVRGHAHQVTDEREVRRLENATHLEPWAGGARDVYVRITPTQISGRRVSQR